MLRQKWGSVVCPGCGDLVGVQDERCLTCGRWNPGLWGFAPALSRFGRDLGFTPFVIASCVALYVVSLLIYSPMAGGGIFNFLSPNPYSLFILGESGATPVFQYGRWWTVLTAGWLHGSILHILFNMVSVRNVAPHVAEFYGASRMVIIYTISGVAGFAVSSFAGRYLYWVPILGGASFTVGASAAICGLIGALLYYGHRTGSRLVGDQAKNWIWGFLIIGFLLRGIDNWAHLGGLAGGYLCSRFLDPLHPERLDHLLIAVGCLVATAIAILVSVLSGIAIIRS